MKCPKCGYVSFPDVTRCRNCGYPFARAEEEKAQGLQHSTATGEAALAASAGASNPISAASPPRMHPLDTLDVALSPTFHARDPNLSQQEPPSGHDRTSELSERVANFRRRRATTREGGGQEAFQFDLDRKEGTAGETAGKRALDQVFEKRPQILNLESIPFETRAPSDSAPELSRSEPHPIEFPDAGFSSGTNVQESSYLEIGAAPIGRRFIAGIIDTLVLVAAGVLFSILVALVGGRFVARPTGEVIAAFIAAFWIFVYFAAFSAIALATPGQAAMGLSLRNLDGELPSRTESLLRAFGYLVSIASLMLGFLWAAMDVDGLAWHDHISGTMLVED